jgi:hypothetical protein
MDNNKSQTREISQKEDFQFKRKVKMTEDEELAKISIKSIEKECLDRVYNYLCTMQEELSSDEDSKQKKYKKEIEMKANEKKMKLETSNYVSKISQTASKKTKKNYKEDENQISQKNQEEEATEKKGKIGTKAIRKVLRTLCDQLMKEEMEMMIWEVDENLDGYVSESEFERMYKKCITDEKELQPKKLFYLTQFLMYDKEKKGYIIEEDTLEILYIRHGDNFNNAINSIFK